MRIALISPYSSGAMRGNIVTVRRIAHFLEKAGVETLTVAIDEFPIEEMQRRLAEFKPDLLHGFHAYYCGAVAKKLAEHLKLPYVLTITGSDINDSMLINHPDTVSAIDAAQTVVCFHGNDSDLLSGYFPGSRGKIAVVPQGVVPLPVVAGDDYGLQDESFVLFISAALRPVKRIELAIKWLSKLVLTDQTIKLVIAGGVIDSGYAETIRTLLNNAPFATWLGEVPHERMGSLYKRADLVLNCSLSESMPNSLMEAMALGRPVLAVDIPGNRSLVQHGKNGWLYKDEADFSKLLIDIRKNKLMREKMGCCAMNCIAADFSPQLEAERYLAIYNKNIA